MARPFTVVFLDIDGVLSIEDPASMEIRRERWSGCGPVWPIPFADALVRALDQDKRVRPVWLTYWEQRAWLWNERAGTPHWPVAFPLTPARARKARQSSAFPDDVYIDEKLLAVCAYLQRRPRQRALWIEDGFPPETTAWALEQQGRVRLIDATAAAIYALLLAEHADPLATARAFLDACLESW